MPRGDLSRSIALLAISLTLPAAPGQVLSPPEIRDSNLRALQQKHLTELKSIATAVAAHPFPYRFYFSRTLDLSEEQQKRSDQRSIQFAKFRNLTVLKITGNYFGAYSGELLQKDERLRRTFEEVLLPILREAVPRIESEPALQAFALEVSHHVRQKVLGVSTEHPENVVLIAPKAAAARLAAAQGLDQLKAAALDVEVYVNGQTAYLWPREKTVLAESGHQPAQPEAATPGAPAPTYNAPRLAATLQAAAARESAASGPPPAPAAPAKEISPETLHVLQSSYQQILDRMARELDKEAHFVAYAPPVFVAFRKGGYLQLSIATTLPETETGSQYRLAALAFDKHVTHLIRPVLAYFKDSTNFDGIDFSSSVRLGEKSGQAVEFIFPAAALRAYEQYDVSGQQLINAGFVLINGERVSLDLQSAEAVQR